MWVIVKFHKQWYLGEVLDIADNEMEVKCMKITGENKFVWPEEDDICWYELPGVLCIVNPPTPVSQRAFGLLSADLEKIGKLVI